MTYEVVVELVKDQRVVGGVIGSPLSKEVSSEVFRIDIGAVKTPTGNPGTAAVGAEFNQLVGSLDANIVARVKTTPTDVTLEVEWSVTAVGAVTIGSFRRSVDADGLYMMAGDPMENPEILELQPFATTGATDALVLADGETYTVVFSVKLLAPIPPE